MWLIVAINYFHVASITSFEKNVLTFVVFVQYDDLASDDVMILDTGHEV